MPPNEPTKPAQAPAPADKPEKQGTPNPADSPKPPDTQRARDLEHPKHTKVGDIAKPGPRPDLRRDDSGRLITDPRPDESEESKKLRKESSPAPGTSGLTVETDPQKAIDIANDVNEFIEDQDVADHGAIQKQIAKAISLNKTVARASQLRKRVDPGIEYPTTRLDPKLKDSDAQLAVSRAGVEGER